MAASRLGTGVVLLLALAFAGLAAPVGNAERSAAGPQLGSAKALTLEQIAARIAEVQAAEEIEPGQKKRVLEILRRARGRLQQAREFRDSANAYQRAIASAPAEIAALRAKLARPTPAPELPAGLTVEQLEQLRVEAQAALANRTSQLRDLDRALEDQQDRPTRARARQEAARQARQEAERRLSAPPSADTPPLIYDTLEVGRNAEWQALSAEIDMLVQERLSYDARIQLMTLRRDLLLREQSALEARVKQLDDAVNQRRRAQANAAKLEAERARQAAAGKHPAVEKLAERNAGLSAELARLVADQARVTQARAAMAARRKQVEQDLARVRRQLEIAGLGGALGQILLDQRRRLRALEGIERSTARRHESIVEVRLAQLRNDDRRRDFGALGAALDRLMSEQVTNVPAGWRRDLIRTELRKLLQDRQTLLDRLDVAYAARIRALGDLDFESRRLLDSARQFAAFLGQHLLWTPSAAPFGARLPLDLLTDLRTLLSPRSWSGVVGAVIAELGNDPGWLVAGFAAFFALLRIRRRLRALLLATADRIGDLRTDRFSSTLRAFAYTALLALPWPLFLGFFGWRLEAAPGASPFAIAVGTGLIDAARAVSPLLLLHYMCAERGLAAAHFRWQPRTLSLIRRNVSWFALLLIPVVFVEAVLAAPGQDDGASALGRLGNIAILTGLAVLLYRLLGPSRGITAWYVARNPDTWPVRLRYVWIPLLIGIPVALAVIQGLGYAYTSFTLTRSLYASLLLIVGAVVLHQTVARALVLAQRRLAWRKAQEKRAAARAARRAAGGGEEEGADALPLHLEVPEIDLRTMNEQSRHLLNSAVGIGGAVALWLIWSGVVPALGILDQISLWQHTVTAGGKEVTQAITLADVFVAALVAIVFVIAARNLPGLLEIAVLQRLPLEPGTRFAITTISQYLIVTVGTVAAFNAVGIGWSQVQWLVAAISVGLGFGLQEIFANFVSGLIILFERPVRIGDTVTVGEVTGTVTRIRIRATTITDWDNKEIVVPNKTLITGQLANWSLTNAIVRVIVRVGIAYGSDTEAAHRLMQQTAGANPLVLSDPAPAVYFKGLGDSSLDFDIYLYVRSTRDILPVKHSFHMAVVKALTAAGIEIPFPQRDVHVRTVTPALAAGTPPLAGRGASSGS